MCLAARLCLREVIFICAEGTFSDETSGREVGAELETRRGECSRALPSQYPTPARPFLYAQTIKRCPSDGDKIEARENRFPPPSLGHRDLTASCPLVKADLQMSGLVYRT